jgi:hypothetical protein
VVEVLNESELQSDGVDDAIRATVESTTSTTTLSHSARIWRMKEVGLWFMVVVDSRDKMPRKAIIPITPEYCPYPTLHI